ncbi:MAG TPA: diguanylate cyclase, partial [Desulfohalobiaceae bacterium]|nr:diguanylate cyclase [Desulfohalobiaceae bacterium]
DPYYIIPTVVYICEGSFSYNGVKDLKGKTVGIETNIYYKDYLQKYPKIRLKEFEKTGELLKQLSFGEIDAVITNINIGNYMKKKYMLENVKMAGRLNIKGIKDEDLRIGVRRQLSELYSTVQAGINQISPREYKTLQDRWVGYAPNEMFQGRFTPDEYSLIERYEQKQGSLRLSCPSNWYPFVFWESKDSCQGIAPDVFSLIEDKQKISFSYRRTKSLNESIAAVKNGEAEIIPAVVPSSELNDKLSLTKPYLTLPLVIATSRDEIFINKLSKLDNKRISYVQNGVLDEVLPKHYPRLKFSKVASVNEGLQRVCDARDFAFLGTIPAITYAIQNYGFYDIKISGSLEEKLPIAAAVQKDREVLLDIVQKSLNSISLKIREKVVDNWISIRFEEKIDYTIVWVVLGVAALVVMVTILWTRKIKSFNERISMANQLLAEKNRELEDLSVTDRLTGLYNRSKIETVLEHEKERFDRTGDTFSIILFDVDWFKSINDTYGHTTGDKVLKEIADRIRKRVRKVDIAGRWGGEEFMVICPGTDEYGAGRLAEDIRSDIQNYNFSHNELVTVSAGVAKYSEVDKGVEQLVNIADKGLYKAKEQKNMVLNSRE